MMMMMMMKRVWALWSQDISRTSHHSPLPAVVVAVVVVVDIVVDETGRVSSRSMLQC